MIIVFILFLFAVSCQTASGHSTAMILIKLGHGETKCISEMFDQFDEPMFKVGITGVSVQPNANKVLLTIRDSANHVITEESIALSSMVKFQNFFTVLETSGVHSICFDYLFPEGKYERTPAEVRFGFELGPGYSTNHVEKGSKKSIRFLEMELSAIEGSLNGINTKFEKFRHRESLLSEAAESTSASILWMSALSIFVLLGTTIFQIIYFVHFFHAKKIL